MEISVNLGYNNVFSNISVYMYIYPIVLVSIFLNYFNLFSIKLIGYGVVY